MTRDSSSGASTIDAAPAHGDGERPRICAVPRIPEPVFRPDMNPNRRRALIVTASAWQNGTVLRYCFFTDPEKDGSYLQYQDGSRRWRSWVGHEDEKAVVRSAFEVWKKVGIGLEFEEVEDREEAEVRIGFMQEDGSWSYIGRKVLEIGPAERTMNFGWSLADDPHGLDTALHEIGHTLGLPHEHQSPYAGIEWNEQAVYDALAKPPNGWDRETVQYNILRKLSPSEVRGSRWDADSVMHYPFEAALIKGPPPFDTTGIRPAGGLSAGDQEWALKFYPERSTRPAERLVPGRSVVLALDHGEQADFEIVPNATRYYELRTFGACDSVLTLFEHDGETWRYLTADDDGGEERNAAVRVKLRKGRRYEARVRLRYSDRLQPPVLMLW